MEREPSGETWPGKSTNNQDLVLSCSGRLDIQNLYEHRSVHQPEGEHYTGHKLTRQMPTKTPRHAAGEHQLRLSGGKKKKCLVLSHSPQRCICKCHACQIVSNCVSRRCHIFPGTEKNQRVQMTK